VHFLPVAPEYFRAMRIQLVAGRDFTEWDLQNRVPRPVIVNAAFAKRYFDGALAAGHRFEAVDNSGATEALTAVGVAADVRYDSVRHPAPPTVYVPFPGGASGALLIRSEVGPASLASVLRDELPRAHAAFRLGEIHEQARLVSDSFARDRA
jgi:putative ABC transport system permease protein